MYELQHNHVLLTTCFHYETVITESVKQCKVYRYVMVLTMVVLTKGITVILTIH